MAAKQSIMFTQESPFGALLSPVYTGDAGFDMTVSEEVWINPHGLAQTTPTDIPCGIRMALPPKVAGLILGRSSAVKRGILVVPTLIDAGYRGPMYVFAYNMTKQVIQLKPGIRIAQVVPFASLGHLDVEEVVPEDLPKGSRDDNGFGSTGGTYVG